MARASAALALAGGLLLGPAGCVYSTAPPPVAELGHRIARDSLTAVDGRELPCCTVTASGAEVTIVAGELRFYALAHWVDTVFTPVGPMSGACVQEVPSGGGVHRNGLVTWPDGRSYLMLPCSTGTYQMSVTELVEHPDGTSQTREVTLSTGYFDWQRNNVILRHFDGSAALGVSLSGASIEVTAQDRHYRFLALPVDLPGPAVR